MHICNLEMPQFEKLFMDWEQNALIASDVIQSY